MNYDPITAAQKAQFVQFVYNMFEAVPPSLTPPVDPGLAANGYQLLYYLNAHDFHDVKFYGYLAASITSPGDLILAIRGTETFQEWLLNFDALPLPYLGKGFVPGGFRAIAESFQFKDTAGSFIGDVNATLAQRNITNPIQSVTVLGHSLGGALATLATAQIAFSGTVNTAALSMWTYASPTVAFPDFAEAFNRAVPNTYRIWNSLDIVPQVPPFPYIHVGQSEELKQTKDQLQHLTQSPPCEHHLTTYEWLLDPARFPLVGTCQIGVPAVQTMVAHVGMQPAIAAAVPDESVQGAAAMADALQNELVLAH